MKKITILICTVAIVLGCSKSNIELSCSNQESDVIGVDEALANLDKVINSLTVTTKSGIVRTFSKENLAVFSSDELGVLTKGTENDDLPDTLLYLLNFNDDKGFAVMSASRKLGNVVYCVTEDGSISNSDFSSAYEFLSERSVETRSCDDEEYIVSMGPSFVPALVMSSIMNTFADGSRKDDCEPVETKAMSGVGPFLKTKWDQDEPFNNEPPPNNYPAGCVVIAVAQIMAYNEHSVTMSYNLHDCQWSTLKSVFPYTQPGSMGSTEAQTQAACFAKELGRSYHCDVNYGPDGSGSNSDKAKRTLKNYGYHNVDKVTGFGGQHRVKARKYLDQGYPVYLSGKPAGKTEGHAWVIDGYSGDYFHCNFGWHGDSDGYYYKDVFNTSSPVDKDLEVDKNVSDKQSYTFSWYFRMITYTK